MILAGFVVAVGVVVDDAIIDMENIVRRLRQQRAAGQPEPTRAVILDASLEVRSAIFYATLINVVAVRAGRSSSAACPARSSSRSRSPTRWPCWPRWSSR